MGKYLKKFENHAAYAAAQSSLILPNVSLCVQEGDVHYNPLSPTPPTPSHDYMTVVAVDDCTFTFGSGDNFSYSTDGGSTWITSTSTPTSTITSGNKVLLRGNITTSRPVGGGGSGSGSGSGSGGSTPNGNWIYSSGRYSVEGNIMSLVYGDNFVGQTTAQTEEQFRGFFYVDTNLIGADNLSLPATTLATGCYNDMFQGCTSLTTAPELPATTLANYCYQGMFDACTSLTTAPELPATTLANQCYYGMFQGCTSLTTAPSLPATTLAESCYYYMFRNCTSLTTAPELPATTLASNCYSDMFNGCTNLTTAPELPATTLATNCYYSMFSSCTSLTTAPVLSATTLKGGCYQSMFDACTSLNYIKAMFTTTPSSTYMDYWVNGVASSGTFVKNAAATWTSSCGVSTYPCNWTVETASS